MRRTRTKRVSSALLTYAFAVLWFLPIYWMIRSSLLPDTDSYLLPPKWFPGPPTFANYAHVLRDTPFPHAIANSFVVAGSSVVVSLLLGVPAAYAIARFRFRGRQSLVMYLLSARMGLPIVVLIALYVEFGHLQILGSRLGLALAYLAFNIPLVTWVLIGFFRDLPAEIEEAARVDGCTRFQVMRHVSIPLAMPGIIAAGILSLIFSLNEFLFAAVLTNTSSQTAPVIVYSFLGQNTLEWGNMSATAVMISLPVVVLMLLVQKRLVSGLTAGAVK